MDEDYQAGRKGLELAAGKGLGVIVMEPVRGGALARNVPPGVQAVWDEAPVKRSPAEWALQWVWSHPEVSFLLSGMNTMEQVEQNLQYADRSRAGLLTGEELALVVRVRDLYRELSPIPCTSCRYCMPCPQGVDIPGVFELYNDGHMYDNLPRQQMAYRVFFSDDERADRCTACGECVEKCPQGISVPEWLEKAQSFLVPC
jgi:predicted aldo/keto reductase-like oxidoreductase